MALLDDIKSELRVSGTDFDTEITGLINTAKSDLEQSGVMKVSDTDALTKMAIVLFCKANFGWDNPEADRFNRLYENIRAKLAVASDYNALKVVFTVTDATDESKIDEAVVEVGGLTITTNSQGIATYYTYTKNADVDYTVSKSGYASKAGSVYVDSDRAVAVAL